MTESPIVFNENYHNGVNNIELIKSEAINTRPMSSNNKLDIRRCTLLLWQFLVYLLEKRESNIIQWKNKKNSEFILVDPEEVARQWGAHKNRPTMNYDKLSRGLRHYYNKNILKKVSGERYVYKFVCDTNINLNKLISNNNHLNKNNTTSGGSRNSYDEKINKIVDDILLNSRKPIKSRQNNEKFLVNSKIKQQQQQLIDYPIVQEHKTSKTRQIPYNGSSFKYNINILSPKNANYDLRPIALNTRNQSLQQIQIF